MPENHAELLLYFGYVPQDGRGEGRFDPNSNWDWEKRRYAYAIENIEKYLSYGWGLHMGYSDGVAHSEEDAKMLIGFAEANIPNSRGLLIPLDAMHGSVRFWRKIRFEGVTPARGTEILQVMQQSGYHPYSKEQMRREGYSFKEKMFMKRNEELWQKALAFPRG